MFIAQQVVNKFAMLSDEIIVSACSYLLGRLSYNFPLSLPI